MSSRDTKSIVPTDHDICGSGLVFRECRKVWRKSARAAMRLELLRCIEAKGLGLAEIENRVKQDANAFHSSKFKSKTYSSIRDPNRIRSDMRPKVRDAYQAVRETVFERSKVSKKLNKLSKKDPDLVERVLKEL